LLNDFNDFLDREFLRAEKETNKAIKILKLEFSLAGQNFPPITGLPGCRATQRQGDVAIVTSLTSLLVPEEPTRLLRKHHVTIPIISWHLKNQRDRGKQIT